MSEDTAQFIGLINDFKQLHNKAVALIEQHEEHTWNKVAPGTVDANTDAYDSYYCFLRSRLFQMIEDNFSLSSDLNNSEAAKNNGEANTGIYL